MRHARWVLFIIVGLTPLSVRADAELCPAPTPDAPELPTFWKNVPAVHPFPRLGHYTLPPSGPGTYSALDCLLGLERQAAPKYAYPLGPVISPPFFDFSWAYLDDPNLPDSERDLFDCLKRVHLGDDFLFGTGGQTWYRHMGESNSRLSGVDNNYDLWRLRAYADLWYRDCVRVYAEFLTAQTFNQDLPPLAIDRDYADLLNGFVELKLAEIDNRNAYLRVGRQELLFGSQRLISTLDWANTRRTFQGARAYYVGEKTDVDLFWVQPVIPNAQRFDSVDNNQNFAGAWLTHRPTKGTFLDLYYLFLDNTNTRTPTGLPTTAYNVHTLGARAVGNKGNFLYDAEAMFQLGARGDASIVAGAGSVGLGWNFKDCPLKPVLWGCYDYASGDQNPTGGSSNTFNPLFPFGHYYLGWIDLVGRQNIHDLNAHLYLYPTNWMTLWLQYHHFQLASKRDALYSPAGAPLRRSVTGTAGTHVGDEVDLVANIHLDNHNSILVGYSYLFAGDFIKQTATTPGGASDPHTWYLMYSFRW